MRCYRLDQPERLLRIAGGLGLREPRERLRARQAAPVPGVEAQSAEDVNFA